MGGDKLGAIGDGLKLLESADAEGWSGPNGVQDSMEQVAALCGGECGLGGLPGLGGEARVGESFERALRLVGEDAGSALDFAGREGNAAQVFVREL